MRIIRRARAYLRWARQIKLSESCPRCGVRPRDVHWSLRRGRKIGPDRVLLETLSLTATLVLNVFDTMLTLAGFKRGILLEANPLLEPLVGSPVVFVTAKMGMVIASLIILWFLRDHRWVLPAGLGLFVVYSFVIAYHLQGLLNICLAVP